MWGGGFGGSGGSGSAGAKTKQLGYYDQETEEELISQAWKVENELSPRVTWRLLLWFYLKNLGGIVGLVDSAREKNKARAVAESLEFI